MNLVEELPRRMKKTVLSALFSSVAAFGHAATPNSGLIQSFDINSETLPPSFKGTSCRPLAAALKNAKLAKDEFESNDQFNKRIQAFRMQSRLPGIAPGTYVSFVKNIEPTAVTYDAENGKLAITMGDNTLASLYGKAATTGFTSEVRVVSERRYSASNSYGATVTVKATHASTCAIGFLNPPNETSRYPETYHIDMTPSVAKAAKSRLSVLYIGTVDAPYVEDFGMYSKPTIHDPTEFSMGGDTLMLWISQYWVFDRATGSVYIRQNLTAK